LIITTTILLLAGGVNAFVISRMFKKEYSAAQRSKMDIIANMLRSHIERLLELGIAIENMEGFDAQCQEILQKHKEVAYVMVVRKNGWILFHNDPAQRGTMIKNPQILNALERNQQTACLSEVAERKYYNTIVPVEDGSNGPIVAVIVGFPKTLIDSKVQELLGNSSMVALVSLGLATFLLLTSLSISLVRPLSRLIATIQQIRGSSDLDKRVAVKSTDEIGVLANAFNNLTTNMKILMQQERKFAAQAAVAKIERERAVELEKAYKELENANKELNDFAYVVSHDLKAPLRGINTLVNWLSADYVDKLSQEGKEQMDLLINRVDRMHNLIDGILQYSRVGRVKEEKTQVNLNELVPSIIDMIAPPENITITIENELPVIECERTRIIQVFQNLLSNAIKYMDKPKGQIRICCVEEYPPSAGWKFSVTDNGPGIEERYFEKIFKIFQTLSPRDEVESTGVGLTVIQKIIEMYGGKIWVESKRGEGSTFFFTLPKQEKVVRDEKLEASFI